jgi:hypothetical protein
MSKTTRKIFYLPDVHVTNSGTRGGDDFASALAETRREQDERARKRAKGLLSRGMTTPLPAYRNYNVAELL